MKESEVTNATVVVMEGYCYLIATVIDDPRFEPYTALQSSMIQNMDLQNRVISTKNTKYYVVGDIKISTAVSDNI